MKQLRAMVRGRVQGVCFRAETVAVGRRLGLVGYARNLPDGSVEVVARGAEASLAALIEFLHRGPSLAAVSAVALDWDDTTPLGNRFEVRH
jgi:acylphosphatase